jgi:methylated-DNA-[protein]-cysteine S-methyltransferase
MDRRHYTSVFHTPIANLGIQVDKASLTGLSWLPLCHSEHIDNKGFAYEVYLALKSYFSNAEPLPRIPLQIKGTDFQIKVWEALKVIPIGTVVSYGELAKQLRTSSRAVGQACRTNPVVLFIPCHRVVSAKSIGGYMGKQRCIEIKKWILEHEGYKCQ